MSAMIESGARSPSTPDAARPGSRRGAAAARRRGGRARGRRSRPTASPPGSARPARRSPRAGVASQSASIDALEQQVAFAEVELALRLRQHARAGSPGSVRVSCRFLFQGALQRAQLMAGKAGSPVSTRGPASGSSGQASGMPRSSRRRWKRAKQLRRLAHRGRRDLVLDRERRQRAGRLADVPLDRMQPVAAVGDVGRADVLGRRRSGCRCARGSSAPSGIWNGLVRQLAPTSSGPGAVDVDRIPADADGIGEVRRARARLEAAPTPPARRSSCSAWMRRDSRM